MNKMILDINNKYKEHSTATAITLFHPVTYSSTYNYTRI